jgi:hypothetical protein
MTNNSPRADAVRGDDQRVMTLPAEVLEDPHNRTRHPVDRGQEGLCDDQDPHITKVPGRQSSQPTGRRRREELDTNSPCRRTADCMSIEASLVDDEARPVRPHAPRISGPQTVPESGAPDPGDR